MGIFASVIASISAAPIFTSAPVQGVITALGLTGATATGQVLALGLIAFISVAALAVGGFMLVKGVRKGVKLWESKKAKKANEDKSDSESECDAKKKISPVLNHSFSMLENNLLKKSSSIKGKYIFVDFCFSKTHNKIQEKIILQKLQQKVHNKKQVGKKCHFGLACFANFAIAAITQPEKIILFDYDPIVIAFNKIVIEVLKLSNSCDEFKVLLVQKCKESNLFKKYEFLPKLDKKGNIIKALNSGQSLDQFENLKGIFNIPESFLANEQHFAYIKKLAVEQNIHLFLGNILDSEVISSITEVLAQNTYYLDSMYISNVYDWFPKQTEILDKHINMLCGKQGTILIKGTTKGGVAISNYSRKKKYKI